MSICRRFAGKKIQLAIENRANNWMNEWAYWHDVKIVANRKKHDLRLRGEPNELARQISDTWARVELKSSLTFSSGFASPSCTHGRAPNAQPFVDGYANELSVVAGRSAVLTPFQ